MKIKQLKTLITKGESETVEFKTLTSQLKAAFETVCAFLNNKGGSIFIGVKDKGQIVGQDISDNTRREIANEIKRIEPTASVDVHYIKLREKIFVIYIHVNVRDHIPYVYDGRAFQRNQSQTDRMTLLY